MKINEIINEGKTGPGLWANIAKRRASGKPMRKKGAPGAPTEKALKAAQAGSKNESVEEIDEACWDSYKQVGMKTKGGRKVPKCVPKEGVAEGLEQEPTIHDYHRARDELSKIPKGTEEHTQAVIDIQKLLKAVIAAEKKQQQSVAEGLDGAVNYTLDHPIDKEYVYQIVSDGKGRGTYNSLEQAKHIVKNMKKTGFTNSFKIVRKSRSKMAGPKGILPEQGLAEGSEELYGLRVGDTVKAVVNGKRVQGDVVDIFPETMEVELLLRGGNAGRTVTVDVHDTESMMESYGSTSVDMTTVSQGKDGHQQSIDFYNQEVDRLAGQADPEFQEWIEAAEERLVASVRSGKPYTHLAKVLSAQQVKKFGGKTLGQTNYGDRFAGTESAYYTPEIRNIIAGPVTNAGNEITRRHELSLQLQTIRSGWRRMSPEDKQNLADQVGYSIEELEQFVKTGQHPDEENDLREMSSFGNQSMKKVRPATPDELRTGYTASKSHDVGADGNVYYFMDPKLKQVGLLRNKQQVVAEGQNGEYDDEAGMAETNLHTIARAAQGLLDTIDDQENLPEWVQEKIAKVEGMMVTAWDYLKSQEEQGVDPRVGVAEGNPGYDKHSFIGKIRRGIEADNKGWGQLGNLFAADNDKDAEKALRKGNRYYNMTRGSNKTPGGFPKTTFEDQGEQLEETYHDDDQFFEAYGVMEYSDDMINESEYQGRKVTLNKPVRSSGGPKKFHVFVKNEKGNVVKVNFGDPNSTIKKNNPARRKSFRARHNCDNPGPKTGARYWSCRKW